MELHDYKDQMMKCMRCSSCKWTVLPQIKSWRFAGGCPSIQYGKFHAYSGGGKVITALGVLENKVDYTEEMLKSVHACSMCGACDVSCKFIMGDMVEPLEIMRALRTSLVEEGQTDPVHMAMIDSLKKEDNPLGKPKSERGKWAEGLVVKDAMEEKVEVFLHAGCLLSYDQELWPIIRGAVTILQDAGVDVGIAKKEEVCCGGRAFDLGFSAEFEKYAEDMVGRVKASGAKTLVTCCADGYGAFKQFYPMVGKTFEGVEVLHLTEYLHRLVKEGRVPLRREIPLKATYHDPCHLGRLGEPYHLWKGTRKMVLNRLVITEPRKEVMFGANGVYDAPRDLLRAIPGVQFTEMERIREYAFCCGAGGGAKDAFPEFAVATAQERIAEARSVGAEAIVTACPWCERSFKDAVRESGENMEVYDVVELLLIAMGKSEERN
jgi:Fe-S oxidoreductase